MTTQVLVVDDSAVVRQTVAHLLKGQTDLTLMGAVPNPIVAMQTLQRQRPDVLLLDIEMPGMDGLTFLRQLMSTDPIPTVICSTLSTEGSAVAVEALAAGAVSVVGKPRLGLKQFLEESRRELLQVLRVAAKANVRRKGPAQPQQPGVSMASRSVQKSASLPSGNGPSLHTFAVNKPVVIGSSTGGTQALEQVLTAMPADAPGIAITQHMPEKFTALYAHRLNGLCAMNVREAKDGDRLERGVALIAPGGKHLQLRKAAGQYFAVVLDGPPVNRHKPSVDVLFRSVADCAGRDCLGIIMTGMGDDGARGMKMMHDVGARTIAQDEASCVVFGMPKEAIKMNAVDDILGLDKIADAILRFDAKG